MRKDLHGPAAPPARGRLTPDLLETLARQGFERNLARDAVIAIPGTPAEALYVVLEGTVQMYVDDASGRVAELQRLGPGDCFGMMSVGGHAHTASFRTAEPSRLCVVPRSHVEELLRVNPDLAFYVIGSLIERVRCLSERIRGLALMDVRERVVRLLEESATPGERVRRMVHLSQQAIAQRIGASPAMVHRVLHELADQGFISNARGHIELLRALPQR